MGSPPVGSTEGWTPFWPDSVPCCYLNLLCKLVGGDGLETICLELKKRGHHLGIAVAYELCMVLKQLMGGNGTFH